MNYQTLTARRLQLLIRTLALLTCEIKQMKTGIKWIGNLIVFEAEEETSIDEGEELGHSTKMKVVRQLVYKLIFTLFCFFLLPFYPFHVIINRVSLDIPYFFTCV